jgi:dipeptidase E
MQTGADLVPTNPERFFSELVALSGKPNPVVLFIPTACSDDPVYVKLMEALFLRFGCRYNSLPLFGTRRTVEELRQIVFSSDIIFVGGGNTQKMLRKWKKTGFDKILVEAFDKGIVLSGVSAGAICWFNFGVSDSKSFYLEGDKSMVKLRGLGLIDAVFCPHLDSEPHRKPWVDKIMKRTPGVSIALEDDLALEVVEEKWRIISARPDARAFKVFWSGGEAKTLGISHREEFLPIGRLTSKG